MADWLNNNLYDYIDKQEKVIVDVRKNDKMCRWSGAIGALFSTLFLTFFITIWCICINALINGEEPDFIRILAIVGTIFVCGYPIFVWLCYNSQRSKRYVLTNIGIYAISGLIFKKFKFVAYNQITDVSMSKGPIQSLFGVGSVGVGTASGNVVGSVSDGNGSIYSIDELNIDSVDNYKEIRELIIKKRS